MTIGSSRPRTQRTGERRSCFAAAVEAGAGGGAEAEASRKAEQPSSKAERDI